MRKLVREKAVRAIEEVIAQQDNELLKRMCQDEAIGKIIDQLTIFNIWHGFSKVDDLSDEVLIGLIDFLRLTDQPLFEYVDYDNLYQEYLDTIKNASTRYQMQQRLLKVVRGASAMFQKDLPEISKREAMDIAEAMLEDTSPTTIYRNLNCASAFCKWCIENQKYPNAQNNFKGLPKVSIESWVKKKLIKDDKTLADKIISSIPLNYGYTGPVLLALAWMGFSRQEALSLRNEEVDLVECTIRGIEIPDSLLKVFQQYNGGSRVTQCGNNYLEWYQEDLGYYLKRLVYAPTGKPYNEMALAKSIAMTGYTYENILLSRQLYDIYQKELSIGQPPSLEEFAADLKISESSAKSRYLEIYRVYKSLFWENA